MKKEKIERILKILKITVLLLCALAFIGLFTPYEKSIGEYRENLLDKPNKTYMKEVDLKNKDVVNISILENFKVYNYAMKNSQEAGVNSSWVHGEAIINVVITILLIVSIVLILLFTILNKNVLVIVFDIILAISSLAMNFDITSRGVLPSSKYTYGISYYLYIVVAILILVILISKKILNKKIKTFDNVDSEDKKLDGSKVISEKKKDNNINDNKKNNVFSYLKKYWYILCLIIVVIVAIILFLPSKTDSDKSGNTNSNNTNSNITENNSSNENANESEKNNNSANSEKNDPNIGIVGTKEINNNVEYAFVKAENGDYVLIGTNKNDGINHIEFTVEFYNNKDQYVGKSYADLNAVPKNSEFALDLFDVPKTYDHYKVFVDVEKTTNKSYVDQLKATAIESDGKIVGQVKNTTNEEIEFMNIAIVFYKNNKVVGHDDTTVGETKPGRSANFEFYKPYDSSYKDMEFDSYKIYINSAHTYSW